MPGSRIIVFSLKTNKAVVVVRRVVNLSTLPKQPAVLLLDQRPPRPAQRGIRYNFLAGQQAFPILKRDSIPAVYLSALTDACERSADALNEIGALKGEDPGQCWYTFRSGA